LCCSSDICTCGQVVDLFIYLYNYNIITVLTLILGPLGLLSGRWGPNLEEKR